MAKRNKSDDPASDTSGEDFQAYPYPTKGFRIGEYEITDTLGHGSMATVFLATDSTGHEIAIKVFQEGPGVSKTMLERFRREAEASKKLRKHPNIITIYSTGREGPYHYITMESIEGRKTLEDALDSSMISMRDIIRTISRIARALHYAHSRNVIHRDVKPTNIMIDEFGEPLLTDFGVAALFDWPSCTVTGALTGTPLYMSPEQARTDQVGPESDIYSLGVVLYEALTGVLPYAQGRSSPVQAVLEAVKNEAPRRPRLFRKEISTDLEAVIMKSLEKDPRDRYLDAQSFAQDLERVLSGRPVSAKRFSSVDRIRYFIRRYKPVVAAIGVALLIAAMILLLSRNRIKSAHYEGLVHLARLRNAAYVASVGTSPVTSGGAARAWQEIRLGRKAMISGDWEAASQLLQSAVNLSSERGDHRSTAIARLDQARCETMLGHRELALDLYKWIIRSADTSPSIAHVAQLEYLLLSKLSGYDARGRRVLSWVEPPEYGPLSATFDCLNGNLAIETFYQMISGMPDELRNDARFVVAVRNHLEGNQEEALKLLKRTLRYSRPPSEWPAPFAKLLYAEISSAPSR